MDEFAPMPPRRGRAAPWNPPGRFERLHVEEDPAELDAEDLRQVPTQFFVDTSRSALARNDSPDIPFTFSLNPYRGCEHGCIYCYARPGHEFLGFSAGLDFETKIVVKHDAPRLLEAALMHKRWVPQPVSLSGVTDPYQPVERRLRLVRQCLEVFERFGNPVQIITKNGLIGRDVDVLQALAARELVRVTLSITTLRPELTAVMEPRTARPALRLKTLETLAKAGIPVGVNVAPIIPGLTDEEMPAILREAAAHGATSAYYQQVRLPGAVRELFIDWLRRTFPDRAERVIGRLEALHGPELRSTAFGERMRGHGTWVEVLERLFDVTCRRLGLHRAPPPLSTAHFRRPARGQLDLF